MRKRLAYTMPAPNLNDKGLNVIFIEITESLIVTATFAKSSTY